MYPLGWYYDSLWDFRGLKYSVHFTVNINIYNVYYKCVQRFSSYLEVISVHFGTCLVEGCYAIIVKLGKIYYDSLGRWLRISLRWKLGKETSNTLFVKAFYCNLIFIDVLWYIFSHKIGFWNMQSHRSSPINESSHTSTSACRRTRMRDAWLIRISGVHKRRHKIYTSSCKKSEIMERNVELLKIDNYRMRYLQNVILTLWRR